jgi:mono/diheme cytochrome c family protein
MRKTLVAMIFIGCGGSAERAAGDLGGPDLLPTPLERGAYLVEHVSGCGDCHTPKNADGSLDRTRWLAGALAVDLDPLDPDVGAVFAPNLTPAGLASWSDDQIKRAFLDGVDDEGKGLLPVMPYAVLHNMKASDADAIVAYLRSLPAVEHFGLENQPLPINLTLPFLPLDPEMVPHTTLPASDGQYASAERGRYLAGLLGACIDCHTPLDFGRVPIDTRNLFAGNRGFVSSQIGLAAPPYPDTVFASNITPHARGIAGWTAADVAGAIKNGVDNSGNKLCAPMPFAAFAGMSDADALDIGTYLTTIPPVDNGDVAKCTAP